MGGAGMRTASFFGRESRRLLVALTEIVGLSYLVSAPIGYSTGLAVGYVLSVTLVFDKRRIADARREFLLFSHAAPAA